MSSRASGALALAVGWLVVRLLRSSGRGRGAARSDVQEGDCLVDECGADGVPLSLYAG